MARKQLIYTTHEKVNFYAHCLLLFTAISNAHNKRNTGPCKTEGRNKKQTQKVDKTLIKLLTLLRTFKRKETPGDAETTSTGHTGN
jgi:hypothetical protein